ncbi:hypothetical protein RB596_008242 [Gaeumannomyces avenae]
MALTMDPRVLGWDIFALIVEELVVKIGPYKVLLLRLVCRDFDIAVVRALCFGRAVEYDDDALVEMYHRLPHHLKANIFLASLPLCPCDAVLSGLAATIEALDRLTVDAPPPTAGEVDRYGKPMHHIHLAEAVASWLPKHKVNRDRGGHAEDLVDEQAAAQNILCGAIVLGAHELVESLLDAGEEVTPSSGRRVLALAHTESPLFGRPLQVAAAWGRTRALDLLLDWGVPARPRAEDLLTRREYVQQGPVPSLVPDTHFSFRNPRASALVAAATGGHQEAVLRLMEADCYSPLDNTEPLMAIVACVRGGNLSLMELLAEPYGGPMKIASELPITLLVEACRYGHVDIVKRLLDMTLTTYSFFKDDRLLSDPETGPKGALQVASAQGNVDLVRVLLQWGLSQSRADANNCLALEVAAKRGHQGVVDLLLKREDAAPERVADVILDMVDGHHERLVRAMLAKNPGILDVHPTTFPCGPLRTAILEKAIRTLHPGLIRMAVSELGVSPSEALGVPPSGETTTPLQVARQMSSRWIYGLLLSLGADAESDPSSNDPARADDFEKPVMVSRSGVRLGPETWEWTGKY